MKVSRGEAFFRAWYAMYRISRYHRRGIVSSCWKGFIEAFHAFDYQDFNRHRWLGSLEDAVTAIRKGEY